MRESQAARYAPPNYPVTWTLAMRANEDGNYERAVTLFRAALRTMEQNLSKRHIDVVKARIDRAEKALAKSKRWSA